MHPQALCCLQHVLCLGCLAQDAYSIRLASVVDHHLLWHTALETQAWLFLSRRRCESQGHDTAAALDIYGQHH